MSHTFFGNKNLHMYVFLYLIILPFPPFWSKGSSQKLLDTLWHISTALANTDYFEAALHVSFFIPGWRDIGDPGSAHGDKNGGRQRAKDARYTSHLLCIT